MKHLLIALLFYGTPGQSQFIPGTDFYNRNKEICDSMNKSKTITFMRNDTLFGRNIFPHGYPSVIWDTTDTYRSNFNYKMDLARWISDSTAIVATYKMATDSISKTGYATVYSRNKARDSIAALLIKSFNNAPSLTIQTVAAAGNGGQVSTTRDAFVAYTVTLVSTASISGAQSGYIVLEICATNSATAANWIEIGRSSNGQAVSLAVVLQSVTTGGSTLSGIIPAGYYRRLRMVNTAGTPSGTFNSGQETLL